MRSGAKESSKLVIIPNRKPLKGSLIVLTATNHQALVVEGIQMLSVMIKTSVDKKKKKKKHLLQLGILNRRKPSHVWDPHTIEGHCGDNK